MRSAAWEGDWPITNPYHPPFHMGVDIGMPVGTRLFCLKAGKVERVQTGMLGILLPGGVRHFYLHIEHASCVPGQYVTPGVDAAISGAVVVDPRFPITGPHLHFEVQQGFSLPGIPTSPGAPLDPIPFLEETDLLTQEEHDWLKNLHDEVGVPLVPGGVAQLILASLESIKLSLAKIGTGGGGGLTTDQAQQLLEAHDVVVRIETALKSA